MKHGPDIAQIAALIGDPARANMLTALMSGVALTASELAGEAGVSVQTASSHLAKLHMGGLVRPRKQGRHKYFSLQSDEVAKVLEGLMGLASDAGHLRTRPGPKDAALRKARVCYNHLAGEMGTQLYDNLRSRAFIASTDGRLSLTSEGQVFMSNFGIDIDVLRAQRTLLCRECLDWSERRSHLAGSLGRAILSQLEDIGWASRNAATRIVTFTPEGERRFNAIFPLSSISPTTN